MKSAIVVTRIDQNAKKTSYRLKNNRREENRTQLVCSTAELIESLEVKGYSWRIVKKFG